MKYVCLAILCLCSSQVKADLGVNYYLQVEYDNDTMYSYINTAYIESSYYDDIYKYDPYNDRCISINELLLQYYANDRDEEFFKNLSKISFSDIAISKLNLPKNIYQPIQRRVVKMDKSKLKIIKIIDSEDVGVFYTYDLFKENIQSINNGDIDTVIKINDGAMCLYKVFLNSMYYENYEIEAIKSKIEKGIKNDHFDIYDSLFMHEGNELIYIGWCTC